MPAKLITAVATEVLTSAIVKDRLKITVATAADAEVARLISQMRDACQQKTNRGVGSQVWEIGLDEFPDAIPLILPPLISVDYVKYYDEDGVLQTLATNQYAVDDFSEPGFIVPAVDVTWPATYATVNAVRVRLTTGYVTATLPPALQLWMLANIGHFEKNRDTLGDKAERTIVDGLLDPFRIHPGLNAGA